MVAVRDALARVEEGAEDIEVPVYDGTEVGLLQSGFNRMTAAVRGRAAPTRLATPMEGRDQGSVA